MADGAGPTSDEDEDLEGQEELEKSGSNNHLQPSILTSKLIVETAEGTTVNLPCKVVNGSNSKYTTVVMTYMYF